jgi:hypothetical protein
MGVGSELDLHLQVFGWKDDLFAQHGGVEQAGHEFLGGLFDLKSYVQKQKATISLHRDPSLTHLNFM